MKIILVATGAKGKNVVFVSDTLSAYTLEETVRLAKEGKIENIYIDEIARFAIWEPITDLLAGYFIGVNTSGGIAQVKTKTARGLIKDGYYHPNSSDEKLSPKSIRRASLSHIYTYVREQEHSIFFAAARMRELIDAWKKFVDLNKKPEIITTICPMKNPTIIHDQITAVCKLQTNFISLPKNGFNESRARKKQRLAPHCLSFAWKHSLL